MEQRETGPWRIAIVEDHLLQRVRTEELLHSMRGVQIVHSTETLPEFVAWLRTVQRSTRPHLLILDLMADRKPSVDPSEVGALIGAGLRVLVLSAMTSPRLVRDVLRVGVSGIIGKRDSETDILEGVMATLRGEVWTTSELAEVIATDAERPQLSGQEERTLVLYASGLTLAEVAVSIGVQRDTAKQYLDRVRAKYAAAGIHLRTKVDLSRIATRDGYLDDAVDLPQQPLKPARSRSRRQDTLSTEA